MSSRRYLAARARVNPRCLSSSQLVRAAMIALKMTSNRGSQHAFTKPIIEDPLGSGPILAGRSEECKASGEASVPRRARVQRPPHNIICRPACARVTHVLPRGEALCSHALPRRAKAKGGSPQSDRCLPDAGLATPTPNQRPAARHRGVSRARGSLAAERSTDNPYGSGSTGVLLTLFGPPRGILRRAVALISTQHLSRRLKPAPDRGENRRDLASQRADRNLYV
jgi:hypothetical protein